MLPHKIRPAQNRDHPRSQPTLIRLLRKREINRRTRHQRRQIIDRRKNKQSPDRQPIPPPKSTRQLPQQLKGKLTRREFRARGHDSIGSVEKIKKARKACGLVINKIESPPALSFGSAEKKQNPSDRTHPWIPEVRKFKNSVRHHNKKTFPAKGRQFVAGTFGDGKRKISPKMLHQQLSHPLR